MKIAAWNIRNGGGKRVPAIADCLQRHQPDLIVLTEYHSLSGTELCKRLREAGYVHRQTTEPPPKDNAVAVISRVAIESRPFSVAGWPEPRFWMEVSVPAFGLGLVGLYVIPHHRKAPALKPRYWGALLAAAEQRRARPFLLVGDFNTGAHYQDEDGATFRCADQFKRLTQSGSRWFDAWRHFAGERREYTWYSRKGGFRLDHAFVSEPLVPRLAACWYSHDEREQKVSDHSILLVELNTT